MTSPPQGPPDEPRLDSWKEIAAYLGRGVRTVQRWEREEGLPVHRIDHVKRGTVYATPQELTAWRESRRRVRPALATNALASATPGEQRLERVTATSAATFWPALSSDARMVVYVSDAGKNESPQVWLQQIGGAAVQLTYGQRDCAEPTFSADDTRILFTALGESATNVYEIPTLGGQPRLVKRNARNARFSPDGKWLAYIATNPGETLQLMPTGGGEARTLAPGLADIRSATWSDDSRSLLVVAHPNSTVELDCWIVPLDDAAARDTGVMRRARQQQGLIVITLPPAWAGDSIIYTAANAQGVNLWRQRISPKTSETSSAPELVTAGGNYAFFPCVTRRRLCYVATHADVNLWSIAVDAGSGRPYGPLRRHTRGAGIVGNLTVSQDGGTLAYFSVSMTGPELHIRNLASGADSTIARDPTSNRGFPAISPSGDLLAHSAIVPGPPVRRPLYVANSHSGESRLIRDDCGGRPRAWLDEQQVLIETFGSGLNEFVVVDTRDGAQRPLLSSVTRRLSNPRVSPDDRWLAFDATPPGGSPEVAIALLGQEAAVMESEWIVIDEPGSHPFWSRDGRLLYYLPTFPNIDIRSRVVARGFDADTGRVASESSEVLTLGEMIVPAMVTGTGPIVAPDQIIFVLGDFRGDVWIRDV